MTSCLHRQHPTAWGSVLFPLPLHLKDVCQTGSPGGHELLSRVSAPMVEPVCISAEKMRPIASSNSLLGLISFWIHFLIALACCPHVIVQAVF